MILSTRAATAVVAGVLVAGGFGAGALVAMTGSAGAATSSVTSAVTGGSNDNDGDGHDGETPLTGATADKVKAAALATYPEATIERLETDSDGVYEAHVTTAQGSELIVQVGKDFTVTGTQTGRGRDGDGDGDGDGEGPVDSDGA